jgi:serine/threonine protein kinase
VRRLHPLLLYEAEANEALFLNARRGKRRTEYLCYTSGRTTDRPDLGPEQCELLARVLGMEVAPARADEWAARSQADEPPAEPGPPPRRVLGEFELLSELGRGGMGVVYRAWQPSLGRQVALKCLFQTGDPKAEARFRREIRALGQVEHPQLVKVFTSGSDGEQWFYAMELVEGATLAAVCDRLGAPGSAAAVDADTWRAMLDTACAEARRAEKPLSDSPAGGRRPPEHAPAVHAPRPPGKAAGRSYVRQVVELVRQVAEAAHALHEAGVIHRDVKPGNILVTADGGRAVLMDLGLAQLADDVEGRLTRTRQFVGTLRYASPEQVLAVGRLDRRSDVYSLGATLYELLTLRPLYGATEQTPTPELMERIQRHEPDRPRRHHPGLPRDLEAVVLKCLQKDPARRYGTALELAEELGRFQAGEPIRARSVGRAGRLGRWCRRNPLVAGLLGVIAASLLAGSAVSAYFAVEASARAAAEGRARREATLREQEARGAEARARAAKEQADQKARELRWQDYRHRVALALREWEGNNVALTKQLLGTFDPGLCGWEWHYARRLCHLDLRTLELLGGSVYSVAYSPDGSRVLAAGTNGRLRLWDVRTGRAVWDVTIPPRPEYTTLAPSVAFSPDGKRVAVACWDGVVRLRDAATGGEAGALRGTDGRRALALAYSPDGKWIAAFLRPPGSWHGVGGEVAVWQAATGKLAVTIPPQPTGVYGLAFSPDGRRLAGVVLVGGQSRSGTPPRGRRCLTRRCMRTTSLPWPGAPTGRGSFGGQQRSGPQTPGCGDPAGAAQVPRTRRYGSPGRVQPGRQAGCGRLRGQQRPGLGGGHGPRVTHLAGTPATRPRRGLEPRRPAARLGQPRRYGPPVGRHGAPRRADAAARRRGAILRLQPRRAPAGLGERLPLVPVGPGNRPDSPPARLPARGRGFQPRRQAAGGGRGHGRGHVEPGPAARRHDRRAGPAPRAARGTGASRDLQPRRGAARLARRGRRGQALGSGDGSAALCFPGPFRQGLL